MSAALGGAGRGAIAAMAMTGMRRITTGLGLLERTPPERMATEGVPSLFAIIPAHLRGEAVELAHWGFGAGAGVAFGLLPRRAREHRWSGPTYGLGIWLVFELVVRRVFRLDEPRRKPHERAALIADHLLYGAVLGSRSPRRSRSGRRAPA